MECCVCQETIEYGWSCSEQSGCSAWLCEECANTCLEYGHAYCPVCRTTKISTVVLIKQKNTSSCCQCINTLATIFFVEIFAIFIGYLLSFLFRMIDESNPIHLFHVMIVGNFAILIGYCVMVCVDNSRRSRRRSRHFGAHSGDLRTREES